MGMKDHEHFCTVYAGDTAREFIGEMTECVEKAEKMGWSCLYFSTSEDGAELYGRQPVSPEEEAKKRERRRKQYLKLKQEFEGKED